jgi:hypothetical protein
MLPLHSNIMVATTTTTTSQAKRPRDFVEISSTSSGSKTDSATGSTCRPIKNNDEDAIAASTTCDDQDEEISMSSSLSSNSFIHPSSKRRRMVQFASDNNVIHSSSSFGSTYVLDDSILADCWYNRQDLSTMKRTARRVCRSFLINNIHSSESLLQQPEEDVHRNDTTTTTTTKRTSSGHSCLFALQDETVRGLESLVCSERQRRQYLTRQFVLTAAKKLKLHQSHHVKKLAWATSRVTHYATQIALLEAKHDYDSINGVAPTNVEQI